MKRIVAATVGALIAIASCTDQTRDDSGGVLVPHPSDSRQQARSQTATTPPTSSIAKLPTATTAPSTPRTTPPAPTTLPATINPPTSAEPAAERWTVTDVVDGDTLDVRDGKGTTERIRLIGIDTPETGECGFDEAATALRDITDGKQVELVPGARDDRDRYDRLLRYIDVNGVDAGLTLLQQGLARARYDSRDGYGRHTREAEYIDADNATPAVCATTTTSTRPAPPADGPGTGPGGVWANCTEARDAGAAPVHRRDPGYGPHLDGDGDGIGCE